jgi:DNA-binding transcriptional ArsR family regulator
MNGRPPAILDHLSALSDATRSRLLLLLDRHQLTVTELCTITQLPQSTVSRHLKALVDSGWIAARVEGTSHIYTMTRDDLDAAARRLWLLVREQVGSTPAAGQDQRRLQMALSDRRTKSQEFFSSSAGQWDRLRDELFGDRVHLAALAAWLTATRSPAIPAAARVRSAPLAPFVARVIAADAGGDAATAKRRLSGLDNVDLRRGELETLRSTMSGSTWRPDAGAASCAGAGESADGSGARAEARRPRDHRGHAPARSRELPSADGARLAGILGPARPPPAERCRLRPDSGRPARPRPARQRTWAVRRDWKNRWARRPETRPQVSS